MALPNSKVVNCVSILVVATFPFTVEVKSPVPVAYVTRLVVLLATRLVKSVVVATPFTVEVSIDPDVPSTLEEMTEEVATTPLMLVVSTLPESD